MALAEYPVHPDTLPRNDSKATVNGGSIVLMGSKSVISLKDDVDVAGSGSCITSDSSESDAEKQSKRGQLCRRCQTVDLEYAFAPTPNKSKRGGCYIRPLGQLEWRTTNSECPLCRLFAFVAIESRNKAQDLTYHLRALDTFSIHLWKRIASASTSADIALAVVPGAHPEELSQDQLAHIMDGGVIAQTHSGDLEDAYSKLYYRGERVRTRHPNYRKFRHCLRFCEENHKACVVSTPHQRKGLRFIDCLDRTIVRIGQNQKYLALSYVWGSSKPSSLSHASSDLIKSLPEYGVSHIIEDAMIVARKLHIRYLWVDQYCIQGQDPEELARQIESMNQVYEAAYATLIAIDAYDANDKLPGVSSFDRHRQARAVVGNYHLVSTSTLAPHALARNKWTTRGWTLQEEILSRRCLYFARNQVYFSCRTISCCEAVDENIQALSATSTRNSMPLLWQETSNTDRKDFVGRAAAAGLPVSDLWEVFALPCSILEPGTVIRLGRSECI
jgi:hypothetical protein